MSKAGQVMENPVTGEHVRPKLVAAAKRNPDGIGSQKPKWDNPGWDD